MLAYVFWHRPSDGVAREDYERSLAGFHHTLADYPPRGFRRSLARRFEEIPWLDGAGPAYEDWYLIEDWTALGELEAGAVSGERKGPHDGVAIAAAQGAGAVYGLIAGPDTGLDPGARGWFEKPSGIGYGELQGLLAGGALSGGACVWRRRLVLGPSPEHCLAGTPGRVLPEQLDVREAVGEPIATD